MKKRRIKKIICSVLGLSLIIPSLLLQAGWSHAHPTFVPENPQVELSSVLEKEILTDEDYLLIFEQTGLSKTAVDELLNTGKKSQILDTQQNFYIEKKISCEPLVKGRFTCEDLLIDENGKEQKSVPLAPLKSGDIFVSFSTHTLGWHHGHAGLVTDGDKNSVLEATKIGSDSYESSASHWQNYSNFLLLRVKESAKELAQKAVSYAKKFLENIPYSLLPGISCDKNAPIESLPGAHCAYLPWRAWNDAGLDLDSNGGRIVTVGDLARNDCLEVVQVYGIEPQNFTDRISGM